MGGEGEFELEFDARARADCDSDHGLKFAAHVVLANLHHRPLAGWMLAGIGKGGELSGLCPRPTKHLEQIAIQHRLQSAVQFLADEVPGELHPADLFIVAQPGPRLLGHRVEALREQRAEGHAISH